MTTSNTTSKLFAALAKAQAEMKAVPFDAQNPFLKNRYASLGAIIESSRATLAKHGLSVVQMPINEGDFIGVETLLGHESGEYVSNRFTMHIGEEKGKSAAQVAGSIVTYLRRYSLGAFLNAYADEDTDGEAASPTLIKNAPKAAPAPAKPATDKDRAYFIKRVIENDVAPETLQEYAVKSGIIKAGQNAELDWPLAQVPTSKDAFEKALKAIKDFANGDFIP